MESDSDSFDDDYNPQGRSSLGYRFVKFKVLSSLSEPSFSSDSSEEVLPIPRSSLRFSNSSSHSSSSSSSDESDIGTGMDVDTPDTSDTEPYEVGEIDPIVVLERLPVNPIPDEDDIIIIGMQEAATVAVQNVLALSPHSVPVIEEDDDCILVPQTVETIDLCHSAPRIRPLRTEEVIEIQDSPASSRMNPSMRMQTTSASARSYATTSQAATCKDYQPGPAVKKTRLNLDDSVGANDTGTLASCPICLESTLKRDPVSTNCGHVFCQRCIAAALEVSKKCPMCKKALGAKNSYHKLYF